MSWIFGYVGNAERQKINPPEICLHSFKSSNLILFAGGNSQTCFFKSENLGSCWAVVGVGLKSTNNGYKVFDENDWDTQLTLNKIILKSVNGHFVALKYSDNELKLFTDALGLREIYFVKLAEGYGFTTRIDWLKYFLSPEIDLNEFGSRWLLQNQISRKSIIKNVIRLVSANAIFKNNDLFIEQNLWQPDFAAINNKKLFDSKVKKLLSIADKRISLSLSGGLDSRLLLSYLAVKNSDFWESHTFGDPNHPDSKIASELVKSLNHENKIIDDILPAKDELIELIKSYSVQTMVTNPVSSVLNLRFYNRLVDKNRVIIDGGFGEIWRRAFANRLLLVGRNSLLKKNSKRVSNLIRFNRADFFSEEVLMEMETGIVKQIDILFDEMPDADQIGSAKWIDLFSIRSRLTNYYAPEQSRVDQYVISFMPLVQTELLNLLFTMRESDMINGKLFKKLISENKVQLTKYPLVKGKIIHPFNSSSLGVRLLSNIKNKLSLSYKSKQHVEIMNSLRSFAGDILHSTEVRNFKYYDRKKVEKISNGFLSKKSGYNSEIDWFLSFELFRQGISQ